MENKKNTSQKPIPALVKPFTDEVWVISLITINTLVLFLDEFPQIHLKTYGYLMWVDYACVVYFILEAFFKIFYNKFSGYWESAWNRFDFIIVLLSLPSLLMPVMDVQAFSIILVLRLGRLIRFFKVLRFVPNSEKIIQGVLRSLKASVGVFIILFILNLAFAMGATLLFRDIAPEYFGNPLISTYSLFKVFTVEGWYEIPDQLASNGVSGNILILVRAYFVVAVIIGGVLGLSLANAVFVDEMTADNTFKVEQMVEELHEKVDALEKMMDSSNTQNLAQMQKDIQQIHGMLKKQANTE